MNVHEGMLQADSLADLIREMLRESDASASAYLIQGWLANAMGVLRDARRRAQLTQEEVARRLGTTQSAIARLEKDHEGHCSLQRYIAYLAACDALPLAVETVQLGALRDYALADPDAPRTATAYQAWRETTLPIAMFAVAHRQGTTEARLETPDGGEQGQASQRTLQGGLAESFESVTDMEALAV